MRSRKIIHRRHLNYISRQPNYRTYSTRSILGYTGTTIEDPDNPFCVRWTYTFPDPYPADSILFVRAWTLSEPLVGGVTITGAEQRAILIPTEITNEGFSALNPFWPGYLLNKYGGGTTEGIDYLPLQAIAELGDVPPAYEELATFAIVFELDPESYFDLS